MHPKAIARRGTAGTRRAPEEPSRAIAPATPASPNASSTQPCVAASATPSAVVARNASASSDEHAALPDQAEDDDLRAARQHTRRVVPVGARAPVDDLVRAVRDEPLDQHPQHERPCVQRKIAMSVTKGQAAANRERRVAPEEHRDHADLQPDAPQVRIVRTSVDGGGQDPVRPVRLGYACAEGHCSEPARGCAAAGGRLAAPRARRGRLLGRGRARHRGITTPTCTRRRPAPSRLRARARRTHPRLSAARR